MDPSLVALRYTTKDKVRLALRANQLAGTSWDSGETTYEDLLNEVIRDAARQVDEMCSGWAPFSGSLDEEARDFVAGGEAVYGYLLTDPYSALPTKVEIGGTDVTDRLNFKSRHAFIEGRSSKDLMIWPTVGKPLYFRDGQTYRVTANWGWAAVPAEVSLAATRIAARSFISQRNALDMHEVGMQMVWAPRFDEQVQKWLGPYLGNNVV